MTSVISKRQQARNERALQDLLRSVPGNDVCADCQARNPGWASWNLGVFLCMRCASLHRKLGTHISKVKSLSMDTWSSEQVESMKRHGNVVVNKTFNPKNVKPDIPLDADEVDSAMERFIRKKYQERSLSNGKPRLPSRGTDAEFTNSIAESPPPPLPPKKGKLFGFGLRASSSVYPSSKSDRKKLPIEPTFEGAFGTASTDFEASRDDNHSQRAIAFHAALDGEDMREKLHVLREMGFRDEEQNAYVLKRLNNRLELAVEYLIKHGKHKASGGTLSSTEPTTNASTTFPKAPSNPATQAQQAASNALERRSVSDQFGLSFSPSHQQPQTQGPGSGAITANGATESKNPFDSQAAPATTVANLEQSFQGMHIARPLFPHSTGGYPVQSQPQFDPRLQHSMTPPVPLIPQQYGFVSSPPAMNVDSNPFFQSSQSSQPPFSNPYASAMQTPTAFASSNPFFSQMASSASHQQAPQQPQLTTTSQNPFGIPPSESQAQQRQFQQQQTNLPPPQAVFNQNQQMYYTNSNAPQNVNQPTSSQQLYPQVQPQGQPAYSNPFGNFPTTQAPLSQPMQPQFLSQQLSPSEQSHHQVQAHQPSQPEYNYQSQSQQPLYPQQTGRIDRNSILALYNYPHLAPQRPSLPSIDEATNAQSATTSPAPSSNPYAGSGTTSAKRSVTMPLLSTNSSAVTGSRNPFLKPSASASASPNTVANGGVWHVSNESVAIANAENGRHSPDAFANLSAWYV